MIDITRKNLEQTKFLYKFLKGFKPKYKNLEIIFVTDKGFAPYKIMKYHKAVEKFGDWVVVSKYDFDDTKTTSVALLAREKDDE